MIVRDNKPALGLTRKTFLTSSVFMLAAGMQASAQTPPTPTLPMPTPDGSILRPYDNAWLFSGRMPGGEVHPQGIWSDHMQFRDVGGRHVLSRVQGMTWGTGASSSVVNVFDPQTMLPISSQTRGPDGKTIRRTFEAGHVTSVHIAQPGAPEITNTFALDGPTYDFYGGMYGLLLATFPLHSGAAGAFKSVEEFDDSVVTATYEVVGRERRSAGSRGQVQTWRVQANRPGQYNMTFWLSQTPPYIIKLELVNEGDPRVLSWDMI
jgi:hypothetical protein